ncbi:tryptophan--tRNA ligase [Halogeometricum borinquense]|uniref:Tryptophan--tRNA ligase n=1 Tax=Halogeometricum borinquense TaxID=60847 RepID=A0A482TKQ0_9EURY|nr:tryptophan--tRNA ligase [Halogeometricum borinquense]RYJ13871.1 tryptophan--tRNA ligase [Halogeometricum borinquense]
MPQNFTVTPYAVDGEVDYDRLLDAFGADALTDDQRDRFPDPVHPMVRRGVFYAGRDVDPFLDAATAGQTCSVVTGRGPSGPMHLGHVLPFYFAKYLQEQTGAYVYVPLSDDEKYFAKDRQFEDISAHVRENLRDLLAVGFNPERTRFVIDTADADVVYPLAAAFANDLTPATVEAVYGEQPNVGLTFYPAVQAAHLLLPQLVHGRHPTLVPVAVDQDPHVRVCRDIAAKERYDVDKPGDLLSRFLPSLGGPGKMSSSDDAPSIELTDDRATVEEKIHRYAHSGGRDSLAAHREHGGDPAVDVAYQYLHFFFESDDRTVERLARDYRAGDLTSGEMKARAAEQIADFLEAHQARRDQLGSLDAELGPYRLTDDERERARRGVGVETGRLE